MSTSVSLVLDVIRILEGIGLLGVLIIISGFVYLFFFEGLVVSLATWRSFIE